MFNWTKPGLTTRSLAITVLLLVPAGASANGASGILWEISFGVPENPDAQYVVLRVANFEFYDEVAIEVRYENGRYGGVGNFPMWQASPVRNGFLRVATDEAADHHGFDVHVPMDPELALDTGRICFMVLGEMVDCVAYGAWSFETDSYGEPLPSVGVGQTLTRVAETGVNVVDWEIDGETAPDCATDEDCSEDEECVDERCRPLPECAIDEDCSEDEVCVDGFCEPAPECATDDDCLGGEECVEGHCVEAPECRIDEDCSEADHCVDGFCLPRPDCTLDSDCPQGERCNRGTGTCVPIPPPPDPAPPNGSGCDCAAVTDSTQSSLLALLLLLPFLGRRSKPVRSRRADDEGSFDPCFATRRAL